MSEQNNSKQTKNEEALNIFCYILCCTKGILLLSFIYSIFFSGVLLAITLAIFTNLNFVGFCIKVFIALSTLSILICTACVLMYNVNPKFWSRIRRIKSDKGEYELYTTTLFIPDIKRIHDLILVTGGSKDIDFRDYV